MTKPLHTITKAGGRIVDAVSDLTNYAAVRVPLQKACKSGEVTLNLMGYRQINTYGCGAIAATMIVKLFHPRTSFERIYAAVDPHEELGTPVWRVVEALHSLGVKVLEKKRLTFKGICQAIDEGSPIMVCVKTYDPDVSHWVVLYGYGRDPQLVFIAGKGLHFFDRQRITWKEFGKKWETRGEGLICQKSTPRKTERLPGMAQWSS